MMRLELKIQEDAFDRAEALAAELRIEAPLALGCLTYLWWWAVRVLRPNPEAAPNGIVTGRCPIQRIEAAARWRGKQGAFVEALINLGLISRVQKKMRVKGTDPYAREQRRKEKARAREKTRRAERKRLLEELQQPKMQKPQLVRAPISEAALSFWKWQMHRRAQDDFKPGADPFGARATSILRSGCAPDREPPLGFGEWFDGLVSSGIKIDSLCNAWTRYLGDEHFRSRRWPVAVFMTASVFRSRLTA